MAQCRNHHCASFNTVTTEGGQLVACLDCGDQNQVVLNAVWVLQGEKCALCSRPSAVRYLDDNERLICAVCDEYQGVTA